MFNFMRITRHYKRFIIIRKCSPKIVYIFESICEKTTENGNIQLKVETNTNIANKFFVHFKFTVQMFIVLVVSLS